MKGYIEKVSVEKETRPLMPRCITPESPNFLDFSVSFLYIIIQRVRQLCCPAPYICDFVLLYRTEP